MGICELGIWGRNLKNMAKQGYYEIRKPELMKDLDQVLGEWQPVLAGKYGESFGQYILKEARQQFEALIPQIPYIGRDKNHLTGSLIGSARCLALFITMAAQGKMAAETGKVLYEAVLARSGRVEPAIPPSEWLSQEELMQRRRERAESSQERKFAGDFVYKFVEGDGETFDYGYNFTECAALKFYRTQGAAGYLRYYCFLDFLKCEQGGLGLWRTTTLAEGHEVCNFRFKVGGKSTQIWPPPFLEMSEENQTT